MFGCAVVDDSKSTADIPLDGGDNLPAYVLNICSIARTCPLICGFAMADSPGMQPGCMNLQLFSQSEVNYAFPDNRPVYAL